MEDAGFLQTAITGWLPAGWPLRPSPWARRCRLPTVPFMPVFAPARLGRVRRRRIGVLVDAA